MRRRTVSPLDPQEVFDAATQRMVRATKLLLSESDRGCVLVAGAMLDDALGALIRSCFVSDDALTNAMLILPQAPLATFSSRIQLCGALGLLAEDVRRDLDRVRQIRNVAAHFDRKGKRDIEFSFEDPDVRDRCGSLTTVPAQLRDTGSPRVVFVMFVSVVAVLLTEHGRIGKVVRDHLDHRQALSFMLELTPTTPFAKYIRSFMSASKRGRKPRKVRRK